MQETWVWSVGQEDSLKEEMATHSRFLAWKIPWTEEPSRLHVAHGVPKSWTWLSTHMQVDGKNCRATCLVCWLSSVQFSHSVVSDSLQPHELQCARPPCPSQTPGVYSNSCPSSRWLHPAISSSVVPFSSCPNASQHQGLFQQVNSSHEVAKILEFQLHPPSS